MATDRRVERLQSQIFREAALIFQNKLNDPRIGPAAVTRVKLSRDLRYCTIYVDPRGESAAQRTTLRGLQSAVPVVQGLMGEALSLRFLPQFKIEQDTHIQKSREMDDIFKRLAEERGETEAE